MTLPREERLLRPELPEPREDKSLRPELPELSDESPLSPELPDSRDDRSGRVDEAEELVNDGKPEVKELPPREESVELPRRLDMS